MIIGDEYFTPDLLAGKFRKGFIRKLVEKEEGTRNLKSLEVLDWGFEDCTEEDLRFP